jgi:GTP diphosphokinase / guanosine-3',5'-bis(diphosphate) 3'-diphosphatase
MTGQDDISMLIKAYKFASVKHADQRRKGLKGEPYINHLTDVADILWNSGEVRDIPTVVAGILHDTIEDTETNRQEVAEEFSVEIASAVMEVTDDNSLSKQKRKQLQIEKAPSLSFMARQVKLADKISNLQGVLDSPPASWNDKRLLEYALWGEKVINRIKGTNEKLEQMFYDLFYKAKKKYEK